MPLLSRLQIVLLLTLIALGVLIYSIPSTARNDLDWQTQFDILPTVELNNNIIRINNLRDFRYKADATIAEVRYRDDVYDLSKFESAWYGISHFGSNGLAHALMSFEFENDRFLTVSIEARLQKKHAAYNPVKGLFRAYTKTIVLATEQDVIGLRTHIRGEPLYLYKLEVPDLYTIPLLLNFLREAQVLTREPTFYNTLIDNCMTGLLAQSDQFRNLTDWMDMRILLPGNSDEIAYELGYIDTSDTLVNIRKKALIDPLIVELGDADFSKKIRFRY